MIDFQALGRLDMVINDSWNSIKDIQILSDRELSIQNDVFLLSRLWVLSGYEIVRILKRTNPEAYQDIYKSFRSVRIPLAKYEKPGKIGSFLIAQLGYTANTKSIGWNVNFNEFITLDSLADKLLSIS